MNAELLQENESLSVPDIDYLARLHQDEQVLDEVMERILTISDQYVEAA